MRITVPIVNVSMQKIEVLCIVLLISVLQACASVEPTGPEIRVDDVWARPAKPMASTSDQAAEKQTRTHQSMATSAVYMKLVNEGRESDRLVRASADVAETVEIHESRMEGDVMKMQHLPDGLEIPSRGEVELKPGGYHVMLIGVKGDLQVGDRFPVVLTFETNETLTVEAEVREP